MRFSMLFWCRIVPYLIVLIPQVTRHVSFPLELDMAPFCSATALALPTLAPGQNQVPCFYIWGSS